MMDTLEIIASCDLEFGLSELNDLMEDTGLGGRNHTRF